MALYTMPERKSKLELIANILAQGIGGYQRGKDQKRQIGRQEEQDALKAALMQARTGQAQRANMPRPPDLVQIAKIMSALQKTRDNTKDPVQAGLLEAEITKMENILAEAQGKEIVTTPGEKKFGGPKILPQFLRDLFARDIKAKSELRPIAAPPPAASPQATSPRQGILQRLEKSLPFYDKLHKFGRGLGQEPNVRKKLAEAGGLTATKPAGEEQVKVISPEGRQGTIPSSQLDDALAQGYRLVK